MKRDLRYYPVSGGVRVRARASSITLSLWLTYRSSSPLRADGRDRDTDGRIVSVVPRENLAGGYLMRPRGTVRDPTGIEGVTFGEEETLALFVSLTCHLSGIRA